MIGKLKSRHMRKHVSKFFMTCILAIFAGAQLSLAQAVKIEVDDPSFDAIPSPGFGEGRKKWDPKDWLEAEVKLNIEARPEPKDGYLDRLQIRWYVAVKNPAGRGFFLLEKDVTYVNVPLDEDVYASVYISPAAFHRLTGSDRASKGAIEAIGGEVSVNGKTETFSVGQKAGWWTSGSLSRTDKFPLLTKSETPFAPLWWDRYLQEEKRR